MRQSKQQGLDANWFGVKIAEWWFKEPCLLVTNGPPGMPPRWCPSSWYYNKLDVIKFKEMTPFIRRNIERT